MKRDLTVAVDTKEMKDKNNTIKGIILILLLMGAAFTISFISGPHLYCMGCVGLNISTNVGSVNMTATGLSQKAEVFLICVSSVLIFIIAVLWIFRKPITKRWF